MTDWGLLTEEQALRIKTAKLNLLSHQIGLKIPEVTRDFKIADVSPKTTLLDYAQPPEDEIDHEEEKDLSAVEMALLKKILRTNLLETTADVEVQRRKDNSPLYSVKSFEDLNIPPNLLSGIYSMGFHHPSKIQELSLPTLLANPPMNMIAQSQSGTGKTAAFLVASLMRVNTDLNFPQVLILAPTFELALQIGEVARTMSAFIPSISCRYAVKDETVEKGSKVKEHIIIGTPGKVFDWARRGQYFDSSKIRVFVLDEADAMISIQGHQDQCIRIHQHLTKESCQMLLFSATYSQEVMNFAEQIIDDPIIIRVRKEEETLDNVHQFFIRCPSPYLKYSALQNIYGAISIGQAIIFCRTKRTASWLGQKLAEDGNIVGYLSSDLTVQQRCDVIKSFREGKEKVLITTNVCARGIDIEQVSIVINFDLPVTVRGEADCETYLHRIGRTGRFGKSGIAINLVCNEKDEYVLKTIENHFGKYIRKIDADDSDELGTMYD